MFHQFDVAVCQHVKVATRQRNVVAGRNGVFRTGKIYGISGTEGGNVIVDTFNCQRVAEAISGVTQLAQWNSKAFPGGVQFLGRRFRQ